MKIIIILGIILLGTILIRFWLGAIMLFTHPKALGKENTKLWLKIENLLEAIISTIAYIVLLIHYF